MESNERLPREREHNTICVIQSNRQKFKRFLFRRKLNDYGQRRNRNGKFKRQRGHNNKIR